MAGLLRADYDHLDEVSRLFASESDKVKASLNSINHHVETLEGGEWIGDGAKVFFREMRGEVIPAMQRLVKALETGSRVTQLIKRIVEQAEGDCNHLFTGLLSSIEGDVAADFQRAGDIAMGELGGLGGQAEGAGGGGGGGGGGGAGGSETPEKPAGGGGGGGGGGAGGGGSGGGGGGSWDGEIGFKQEKPAPGAGPAAGPGRRRGAG